MNVPNNDNPNLPNFSLKKVKQHTEKTIQTTKPTFNPIGGTASPYSNNTIGHSTNNNMPIMVAIRSCLSSFIFIPRPYVAF
jgi:hypothetical protein